MPNLGDILVLNINRIIKDGKIGSQVALARMVEMDPGQFNKILKGKQKFPLWLAEKISEKTGYSVEELLGITPGTGKPIKPSPIEMAIHVFDSLGIDGDRGELIKLILENNDINFKFYLGVIKGSLSSSDSTHDKAKPAG